MDLTTLGGSLGRTHEGLQNENLHASTQPEQFRPYLGMESEKWWDKLIGFWERREPMMDD